MSLRKRSEKSEFLAACIAWLAGKYLAFCTRKTTWQSEGLDELKVALNDGPVLLVMWHSRCIMAAEHWPVAEAPLSSLYNNSPVGRLAGALHRRVGLHPMEMSRRQSNRSASRTVLKRVKEGVSIGMTGDGPIGPALQVQDAVLDWARTTGMPVFCYAFSTAKSRRLNSWDQLLVPKAYGNGAFVYRRFEGHVARKMDAEALETLRAEMKDFMDMTTHRADTLVGLAPGA